MSTIEQHPLEPFLPQGCKVLFLGSFPPPHNRWCMEFFYPNFINDHWRIMGEVYFDDRNHFVDTEQKRFKRESIIDFLSSKGIGYYDTATAVQRLKDNASDLYLKIITPTDIRALLQRVPECRHIATTGEKATQTICNFFGIDSIPAVNGHIPINSHTTLHRLPSSSRAYPLSFDKKTACYKQFFVTCGLISV